VRAGLLGRACHSLRAARDFAVKQPRFAAEIGLFALQRLLDGSGYDPAVSLMQEALDHLLDGRSADRRPGFGQRAGSEPRRRPCSPGRRHMQRVLAEPLTCWGEKPDGNREPD